MDAQDKHKCRRCTLSYCLCKDAANENYQGRYIYLYYAAVVETPSYVQNTARALNELKRKHGLSDQAVPKWIGKVLANFVKNGGILLFRDSTPFDANKLPDFDIAFGEDIRVTSIRDLLGYAYNPPANTARIETFSRVRLISTAMLIAEPEIAKKCGL